MSEYVTRAEFEEKLDIKRDTETLKADVATLKTGVESLQVDTNSLKADVKTLQVDVNSLKADVKILQTEIKRLDEKIDLTRSELSAKGDSLKSTLSIVVAFVILILSTLVAGFIKLIFFSVTYKGIVLALLGIILALYLRTQREVK